MLSRLVAFERDDCPVLGVGRNEGLSLRLFYGMTTHDDHIAGNFIAGNFMNSLAVARPSRNAGAIPALLPPDRAPLTCIYSIGKQICHRKADRSNEANQLLFWPTQTKVVPKGIRAP